MMDKNFPLIAKLPARRKSAPCAPLPHLSPLFAGERQPEKIFECEPYLGLVPISAYAHGTWTTSLSSCGISISHAHKRIHGKG